MEDELKSKYVVLKNNLINIRQHVNKTISTHNTLVQQLKRGLYIDKNIICSSNLYNELNSLNEISSNISSEINSINHKL